jgi:hypothetical protein
MLGRSERLVRGWIAGSFAIATAAVSHVVGGGSVPSALALGTGAVFAVLIGTLAMGRRPSLPRLGVAVAGSQLAFHLLFSSLSPGVSAHAAGLHHGAPTAGSLDLIAAVPHAGSPAMWIAHAVAMVATLVFLRRAELSVWRMVRREFDRLGSFDRILRAPQPTPTARLVARAEAPALRPAPFLAAFSLRGPPVAAAH